MDVDLEDEGLRLFFRRGPSVYMQEMPFSEVCMHLGVAGRPMRFRVVGAAGKEMVQLLNADESPFSFPILPGEAGLFRDSEGRLYS